MNAYEAKFAREAKAYPTCWIITPNGLGGFNVVRIAKDPRPKPQFGIVSTDGSILARGKLRIVK